MTDTLFNTEEQNNCPSCGMLGGDSFLPKRRIRLCMQLQVSSRFRLKCGLSQSGGKQMHRRLCVRSIQLRVAMIIVNSIIDIIQTSVRRVGDINYLDYLSVYVPTGKRFRVNNC